MKGICSRWFGRKFGFIKCPELDKDVFVHYSDVVTGHKIAVGDAVEFDTVPDTRDGERLKAVNVRKIVGGANV
jgi:cold shock CspA family protein